MLNNNMRRTEVGSAFTWKMDRARFSDSRIGPSEGSRYHCFDVIAVFTLVQSNQFIWAELNDADVKIA